MEFQPLYHAERLRIINPHGDVGVVTLWTKVDSVFKVLSEAGVDLSPEGSRVAVMANLYGNGLPHMLRNLLHNPQIKHLIICGQDLSGSKSWLQNFFERGLEEVVFLGAKGFRIVGTERIIDGNVQPEHFPVRPNVAVFAEISASETKQGIAKYLLELAELSREELSRVDPPLIPEPSVTRFPSHPSTHLVHRKTPTEAWRELIFRLYRFGYRNTVKKSTGPEERVELHNVHVVVDDPSEENEEVLAQCGFNLAKFHEYQKRILDPRKPEGQTYSYGWLLRTGMREEEGQVIDSVEILANRIAGNPDSRHAYATLWDNGKHLPAGEKCPCFVTLFFRKFEEKLTLTATFRAHNAMDAWLENVYGLIAIQRFVANRSGMVPGSITVISHSVSLDPAALERAKRIVDERTSDDDLDPATGKRELRLDPNGAFTVTFDRNTWELVAEHLYEGMKLGEYRGKTCEQVEAQIVRDLAITLPSHALYLGRELARKEVEMKRIKAGTAS